MEHNSCESPKLIWNNLIITTLNTTVKALGRALKNTFKRKLPFTSSWLGSSAKINDGTPIVKNVIKVKWIGIKKYSVFKNIQAIINIIVNIVLLRRSDELLSILLIFSPIIFPPHYLQLLYL